MLAPNMQLLDLPNKLDIVYNTLAGYNNHYHEEGVAGIYQQVNSNIENEECPRIIGQFINYMKVVIRHRKSDYIRILARQQHMETPYQDVYEAVEPDEANYEDTYWEKGFDADAFKHNGLGEAFTQLSTKDQTILAMTYMQQFTDAEIATKMSISQRYVRNARYRAIKKTETSYAREFLMVENDELYVLIERVNKNDREAIDELLWHFDPMIKRWSYVNRGFDEDCCQHLRIGFVKALDGFMNVPYPVWEMFRDIKRVAARKEAYAKWLGSQDGETHP